MENDSTILRLHFPDDAPNEISMRELSGLISDIEKVFHEAMASFGGGDVTLYLVASPTSGSLSFFFKPRFRGLLSLAKLRELVPKAPTTKRLTRVSAYATVGALAWVIVFGGRGIVDLIHNSPQAQRKSPRDHVLSYGDRSSDRSHSDISPRLILALDELVVAGSATDAERIEIELPDERIVVLYDRYEHRAIRRPPRDFAITISRKPFKADLQLDPQSSFELTYRDVPFQGCRAVIHRDPRESIDRRAPNVIYVWPASDPRPPEKLKGIYLRAVPNPWEIASDDLAVQGDLQTGTVVMRARTQHNRKRN